MKGRSIARRHAVPVTLLGLAFSLVACQGGSEPSDGEDCVLLTWNRDADDDGYGDPGDSQEACEAPAGFVGNGEDCDDADPERYPLRWFQDGDGDGYGAPDEEVIACDAPEGFVANDGDCDDTEAERNRLLVLFPDSDDDGFGDVAAAGTETCGAADGYVDNSYDCDDGDDAVGRGTAYFPDQDDDGYGDPDAEPTYSCEPVDGLVSVDDAVDCDDSEPTVHPGATEICDDGSALDNDCDGLLDTADPSFDVSSLKQFFLDADRDGFGVPDIEFYWACEAPDRFADNTDDCDDSDAEVYPGAIEICDGEIAVDNDCDGVLDDADASLDTSTTSPWYPDVDGDGHGDPGATPEMACVASDPTWVLDATDCAPDDIDTYPGAIEVCDDISNDCDATDWVSDAGLVTFWSSSGGSGVSMAAHFGRMASGDSGELSLSSGTLQICEGDWPAHLVLGADMKVIGVGEHGTIRLLGLTDIASAGVDIRVIETSGSADHLTLENLVLSGGEQDVDDTIYDPSLDGTGGALRLADLTSATLNQITIEDSSAIDGAGLYMDNVQSATWLDLTVRDCHASSRGGGVFVTGGSTVTASNVVLESNASDDLSGGLHIYGSTVTFEPDAAAASPSGLVMTHNESLSSWAGSLYVNNGALSVTTGYLRGDDSSQGIFTSGRGLILLGSATFDAADVEFVEFPVYSVRITTTATSYDYDESGLLSLSCDATECTVQ